MSLTVMTPVANSRPENKQEVHPTTRRHKPDHPAANSKIIRLVPTEQANRRGKLHFTVKPEPKAEEKRHPSSPIYYGGGKSATNAPWNRTDDRSDKYRPTRRVEAVEPQRQATHDWLGNRSAEDYVKYTREFPKGGRATLQRDSVFNDQRQRQRKHIAPPHHYSTRGPVPQQQGASERPMRRNFPAARRSSVDLSFDESAPGRLNPNSDNRGRKHSAKANENSLGAVPWAEDCTTGRNAPAVRRSLAMPQSRSSSAPPSERSPFGSDVCFDTYRPPARRVHQYDLPRKNIWE
eukprot:TRINITY_DN84103_c0_g1_i1.p1 TRINITY_DN84103_c0_g1~~TRINITY_DN84103_c0_g1_i1.p1  ORF type:complete len:302 (+),score=16.42 TRINITY_DN84103_c0_g1_i1:31-906(+)